MLKLINWELASRREGAPSPADASATQGLRHRAGHRGLPAADGGARHRRRRCARDSPGALLRGRIERMHRSCLILTFGGGTNEIQRDIIGMVGPRPALRPALANHDRGRPDKRRVRPRPDKDASMDFTTTRGPGHARRAGPGDPRRPQTRRGVRQATVDGPGEGRGTLGDSAGQRGRRRPGPAGAVHDPR